jgi:hypothetical protein
LHVRYSLQSRLGNVEDSKRDGSLVHMQLLQKHAPRKMLEKEAKRIRTNYVDSETFRPKSSQGRHFGRSCGCIPGGVRVVAFWQANEGRGNTRLNSRMTYGGKCQNREIEAAGQDSRQSEGARRVYKAPSRPPRLFFFQPSTNSTSTQNQSINQSTNQITTNRNHV